MDFEIAAKILAGAAAGSLLGFVLGRAHICGAKACNVKRRLIINIIAGAIFGAAVAWWAVNR